jgi:transposase
MKPYSKDLRMKVLAAVDRGTPREEVAEVFGVSVASIKRWLKRRRETGEVEPKPNPGPPPAKKGSSLEQALPSQLHTNPDFTLEEHRELFEETYGISVSTSSVSRAFERLGLPLKKRHSSPQSARSRREDAGARG